MGTGQTLQEGGWLDFYALTPLHAATVPGMRWYNHQMERYGWTFMHQSAIAGLGYCGQHSLTVELKNKGSCFLDLGKYHTT